MIEPQIIVSEGKAAFVVVPYADWLEIQACLENASDIAAAEAFRANPEETFPMKVAKALINGDNPVRVFRNYRGLTLKEVADKCGIAIPYLSQIETGKRTASVDVVKKVAAALAVSVDLLI
jgi:DNA-binding XRE family transcriptional regulator